MQVLVIGPGGREHALAWCLAKSPQVSQVYVAPGNYGTQSEPGVTNIALEVNDHASLIDFVKHKNIELTIVGPEQPIAEGIRDQFDMHDLKCFAPSQAAGQLESSKSFAKAFMQRHNIPTARAFVTSDICEAIAHLEDVTLPVVLKADGLAAGKGVVISTTRGAAMETAENMLSGQAFGQAGRKIVIEEFLVGEEASFIVMTDGKVAVPFASSQDHKPVFDGDEGPNTGGMGAYSPAPVLTSAIEAQVMERIVNPTIQGMAIEGNPFQGFLYVGLMISDCEPYVVEFNCRFGDPEAQPVLYRLKSDLAAMCELALGDGLVGTELEFDSNCTVAVVLASGGYPGNYQTGLRISGLNQTQQHTKIFHAGTRSNGEGEVLTSGGRVLAVLGAGKSTVQAIDRAYARAQAIQWKDMHFRSDIGSKALGR
ncbi:MAG: phosphoribosylamine--glycine ligase [Gammaproteobacteria bacterium]|nr:phosphoribosylamine--glycine ligase [Gammaproteobacteria bacterium]MXX94250.1 phosphoribosylamine--glycine ligase [Gammaproteobacteria bacterium]MYF53982.1 phosphoribosylamine--glycine ligase [Gammaproteobacteria bacterium]MYK43660.1 phosphoribosylamine--glycine ligase [Gammaproteobacteria bacterium]